MKNTEIEHKYLVTSNSFKELVVATHIIRQGYLCTDPYRTIRIRQQDDKGYITIKSKQDNKQFSRFEWEREISLDDVTALLPLCLPTIIEKRRHIIPWNNLTIEVDEYIGKNAGLIVAEIELDSESQEIGDLPDFIGTDISGDTRYLNSYLSINPFQSWEKQ